MSNLLAPLIVVKFQRGIIILNHIDILDKPIEVTLVGNTPLIVYDQVNTWLKEKTQLVLDLKTNDLSEWFGFKSIELTFKTHASNEFTQMIKEK